MIALDTNSETTEPGVLCRPRPATTSASARWPWFAVLERRAHLPAPWPSENVRGQRTPERSRRRRRRAPPSSPPRPGGVAVRCVVMVHIAPWLRDPEQGETGGGKSLVKGEKLGGVEGVLAFSHGLESDSWQWIPLPSCSVTCGVTRIGHRDEQAGCDQRRFRPGNGDPPRGEPVRERVRTFRRTTPWGTSLWALWRPCWSRCCSEAKAARARRREKNKAEAEDLTT